MQVKHLYIDTSYFIYNSTFSVINPTKLFFFQRLHIWYRPNPLLLLSSSTPSGFAVIIFAGAAESALYVLTEFKSIYPCLWLIFYFQTGILIPRDETLLRYRCSKVRYLHCSDVIRPAIPRTRSNHSSSLCILLVKWSPTQPRSLLWGKVPKKCFPYHHNLSLIKFKVNHYLSYIFS